MQKCLNCNSYTDNPKFCCKSCSAIFNNSKNPKRKKRKWHCEKCGEVKDRPSSNARTCDECRDIKIELKYMTIGELRLAYRESGKQNRNTHTYIRERARRILHENNLLLKCSVCGYDKHVEACHIKPVASYGDDTVISDINSIGNLISLCPNCHWELDHGLLKI